VLRGLVGRALAVQRRLRHFRLLEFEDRAAHHLGRFGRRDHRSERISQSADRARVKLRDPRFVDANLSADLFHRGLAVVIEADHFLLAGWQGRDCGRHAFLGFLPLVGFVGLFRL